MGEPSRVSHVESTLVIENASVGESLQNRVMCMRTFEFDHSANVGDGIQ